MIRYQCKSLGDDLSAARCTRFERDEETGLDFAEARYYYNNHGRFTAVDPLLASGKSADPQTFNRYAYTMNRPLILTDPTGLQAGTESEDTVVVRIQTWICESFWCKLKSGANQLIRSLIGNSGPNDSEEEQYRERKRSGVDKQVGNAIKNYANDVDSVTQTVLDNDPTGIGNAVEATVNNSLGRASDEEVYSAMANAALNTASTLYTPGKAFKIAKEGGKHAGFLSNYLSRSESALNKAIETLQSGKRGIDVHLDKIANPSKYVKNWGNLRKEHQESLIRNWQKEINNAREQIEILKGILSER